MSDPFEERMARTRAEQTRAREERAREAEALEAAAQRERAAAEKLLPELYAAVATLRKHDTPSKLPQVLGPPHYGDGDSLSRRYGYRYRPGEPRTKKVGIIGRRRTIPVPPSVPRFGGWSIRLSPIGRDYAEFYISADEGIVTARGEDGRVKTIEAIVADGVLPSWSETRGTWSTTVYWSEWRVSAADALERLLKVIADYLAAQ